MFDNGGAAKQWLRSTHERFSMEPANTKIWGVPAHALASSAGEAALNRAGNAVDLFVEFGAAGQTGRTATRFRGNSVGPFEREGRCTSNRYPACLEYRRTSSSGGVLP